jgi:tetratricopeptide (TPR) repeat protein
MTISPVASGVAAGLFFNFAMLNLLHGESRSSRWVELSFLSLMFYAVVVLLECGCRRFVQTEQSVRESSYWGKAKWKSRILWCAISLSIGVLHCLGEYREGFAFTMGQYHYSTGNYSTAANYFTHYIENTDNKAVGHRWRGVSWFRLGDERAALRDYELAAQLQPEDWHSYDLLLTLLLHRNDRGRFDSWFDQASRNHPEKARQFLVELN